MKTHTANVTKFTKDDKLVTSTANNLICNITKFTKDGKLLTTRVQ